jgi:phosphoribosylanthranilate isomerase
MLVKICGITRPEDARLAIEAGADMLGFVFVPGTPRGLDPDSVGWIAGLDGAATVGVFSNAGLAELRAVRDRLELDWVQLHGDEPNHFIEELGPNVVRRVVPRPELGWDRLARLAGRCLPLIDPGGGGGVAWDWERLGRPPAGLRFGLAGGLNPDNVGAAIHAVRPALVDSSSGIESAPGVKDRERVETFIRRARAAAREAREASIE